MVRPTDKVAARPRGMPPGWTPAEAAATWARSHPPPFSPRALQATLDGDEHDLRRRLRAFLTSHHSLFAPVYNASLPRFRELSLARLVAICRAGEGAGGGSDERFLSVRDFAAGRASRVLAAHEIAGLADGSMATKLTVQFNLFGGTVARLGTATHHDVGGPPGVGAFLDAIDSCREVGCFALTEAAYGNNAVEMETTATFVGGGSGGGSGRGQGREPGWVIHTPRPAAAKLWITNGACHAGWAVVFAQLETGGRREGVHAFLVRIRDAGGQVLRGVTIEDMGVKMGNNGVDNARLTFDHLWAPRTALLDRFSSVSPTGAYFSPIPTPRTRFLAVADQLLSGRLCIAAMILGTAKLVLTISTTYATTRLSVGPSGASDTPLLSYQLQQRALAPLVARTYAANVLNNFVKRRYSAALAAGGSGLSWAAVVALCCTVKPYTVAVAAETVTVCRERVGGAGFLAANRFGDAVGFVHAGMTAEGDNAVLRAKCAGVVVELMGKGQAGRLYEGSGFDWSGAVGGARFSSVSPLPAGDVTSLAGQAAAFAARERHLFAAAAAAIAASAGSRSALYETLMHTHAMVLQRAAVALAERLALAALVAAEAAAASPADRAAWAAIRSLYALDAMARDAPGFLAAGLPPAAVVTLDAAIDKVVRGGGTGCAPSGVGPCLASYVDAFGVGELTMAPIGGDWLAFSAAGRARFCP